MLTVYAVYTAVSLTLTVWVARTLSVNGLPFLVQVFHGNRARSVAVNHLLVTGFYLLNIGFVCLTLTEPQASMNVQQAMELVSQKVGLAICVLGCLHLANLFTFCTIRDSVSSRIGLHRR